MASSHFVTIDFGSIDPEHGAPAADRIISGDPQFRTWNCDEADGGLYAGIWEATPGKWRIVYDEWEFCHILSGRSIVTEEGGKEQHLQAGDSSLPLDPWASLGAPSSAEQRPRWTCTIQPQVIPGNS